MPPEVADLLDFRIYLIAGFFIPAILEAAKPIKYWNNSYAGIVGMLVGAVLGAALAEAAFEVSWAVGMLSGAAGSLTASGGYSVIKATAKARDDAELDEYIEEQKEIEKAEMMPLIGRSRALRVPLSSDPSIHVTDTMPMPPTAPQENTGIPEPDAWDDAGNPLWKDGEFVR